LGQVANQIRVGCCPGDGEERAIAVLWQRPRAGVSNRTAWLTGASLGIIAALAGSPPRAFAACLGENSASVTCDATNQASAGTLTTSFAGATVVNVNAGGKIDTGGASATVTAAGSLTFNNNDTIFGITNTAGNGVTLANDFGAIAYTGSGTVTATSTGPAAGISAISNSASGGIDLTTGGAISVTTPFGANAINAAIINAANASAISVQINGDISVTAVAKNTAVSVATSGLGGITVTDNGAITTNFNAIDAFISNTANASALTVHVNSNTAGFINAEHDGTGSVLVDASGSVGGIAALGNGNVTVKVANDVNGTPSDAVSAQIGSSTSSGTLTVSVTNGNITAGSGGKNFIPGNGILASTAGLGATSVTLSAAPVVSGAIGILASATNASSTADIIVSSDATVTGIAAGGGGKGGKGGGKGGSGPNEFDAAGLAVDGIGIGVSHSGTGNISVTTGAHSAVTGDNVGIQVLSGGAAMLGGGNISATIGGTVSTPGNKGSVGVLLYGGTTNTLTNTGLISGGAGVQTIGGSITLDNAGSIAGHGGPGGHGVDLGGAGNVFIMDGPNATLSGGAFGSGNDTFRFAGTGANSFDVSQIDAGWTLLEKTGSSIWTLTGTSTYTGNTTISAGVLQFSTAAAMGGTGANITVTNGGTAAAGYAIDQAFLGRIASGSGGVVALAVDSANSLDFNAAGVANVSLGAVGSATFSGTLTPFGTTYRLGGGDGTLTVTSVLGGANSLIIDTNGTAGGTVILTGANTYSGGTTIAGGTLAIGADNNLGTGPVSMLNGTTLQFLQGFTFTHAIKVAGDPTFSVPLGSTLTLAAAIADGALPGDIVKTGGGTLILAASNTYTGGTTVSAGTLEVDGSIASSGLTTVNSGTLLTGAGTAGNTQVNAGAIFAPGNGTPGSSMTIAGNLAFQAGAIYLVQLNPSTASLANVAGSAQLGGATVAANFAGGNYVSKQYTILTAAGGVSGTFGAMVDTNLPSGFHTSLSYDPTHAYLNLALNFTPPTPPNFGSGLSGNQLAVGNALTNFFNANGSIPLVFGALTPAGLTQISGEGATGSQQTTFNAMNQFMALLTDPFIAGRGDSGGGAGAPTPYAEESLAYAGRRSSGERDAYAALYTKAPPRSFEQRWTVWAAGFGGSQTSHGDPVALGSNDTRSSIFGTTVGADYWFSPRTVAGFALAGGGTSFGVNGLLPLGSLGSGHSDLFQAGAFVRHTEGPAYLTGALAYGWQDITTNRTVAIAGIDQLRAEFNANAWSGRVEGGYRLVAPVAGGVGVTPYAAGQFTTFGLPAYTEQAVVGTNLFALAYNARTVTDARSEFGLRTDKSFALQDAILTLRGRFAWAHDFNPDRAVAATFQTLPGASFVVNGARQASDAALTTASIEAKWLNGWSVAASFDGEFSSVTRSYAGKGVVRYQW
jgi:autotransporter-associated beta strand protein